MESLQSLLVCEPLDSKIALYRRIDNAVSQFNEECNELRVSGSMKIKTRKTKDGKYAVQDIFLEKQHSNGLKESGSLSRENLEIFIRDPDRDEKKRKRGDYDSEKKSLESSKIACNALFQGYACLALAKNPNCQLIVLDDPRTQNSSMRLQFQHPVSRDQIHVPNNNPDHREQILFHAERSQYARWYYMSYSDFIKEFSGRAGGLGEVGVVWIDGMNGIGNLRDDIRNTFQYLTFSKVAYLMITCQPRSPGGNEEGRLKSMKRLVKSGATDGMMKSNNGTVTPTMLLGDTIVREVLEELEYEKKVGRKIEKIGVVTYTGNHMFIYQIL